MRFHAKTDGGRVGNVGGYLHMKIHRPLASLLKHITAAFVLVHSAIAAALPAEPLKVFILAGQSNMEGQAVVDLAGKDYNQGKGTLATLMADQIGRAHV